MNPTRHPWRRAADSSSSRSAHATASGGSTIPEPPTLAVVVEALRSAADSEAAAAMSAYMRDQFPFLGLPKPARSAITADYVRAARRLEPREVLAVLDQTFNLPEREFHYLGVDVFARAYRPFAPDDIARIVPFIDRHAWWDSVDSLRKPLGLWALGRRRAGDRDAHRTLHDRLLDGSMWQRRVAITLQLQWKQDTDLTRLTDAIARNAHDREFFIQKAIGWALRDYAHTDPEWVAAFVDDAGIAGLARREALKHLPRAEPAT